MNDTYDILSTGAISVNETLDGEKAAKRTRRKAREESGAAEKARTKADPWIWGIYIFLLIFSVIELYSASSTQVKVDNVYLPLIQHGKFLLAGFLIILGFQKLHYKWFRKYAVPFAVIAMGLLIYSFFFGQVINGAQRSISMGPLGSMQPAEFGKLACMTLLAFVLAKNQMAGGVTIKGIVVSTIIMGCFAGLTFRNGLTNTLLLAGVAFSMMLIGGIQWKKFFIAVAAVAGIVGFFYMARGESKSDAFDEVSQSQVVEMPEKKVDRSAMRLQRLKDHLKGVSPTDPITDENRQVMFSHFSQANGSVTGRGPGNNRESVRLPLAFSDYIFAIVIEDTGIIGGCFLLFLYLALLGRAGYVASKCSRAFPALLIMGCAVMIVFQALIHMVIVTGLSPVSGQPLPFISMGGTSIIVMSMALGMMLSVSRYAVRGNDKKQINSEIKELPVDINTENPSQL